jgi:hypothetical protein
VVLAEAGIPTRVEQVGLEVTGAEATGLAAPPGEPGASYSATERVAVTAPTDPTGRTDQEGLPACFSRAVI